MTLKRWLKTIYLFPMMMLLGIEPEAGADTQTDTAEDQGNPGDDAEGADTQETDSAESQTSEADETESQETEEGTEENKDNSQDKGAHQTTLEERAGQIAEKKIAEALEKDRAERQRIETETQERLKAQEKPFIDLTPEQSAKINEDYTSAVAHVAELQELLRLGDRSTETVLDLRKTEKWIRDTEAWYADNEAKKAAWTKTQGETAARQAAIAEQSQRLEATAEVYREAQKVPQNVWDESSKWFAEQLKTDRLLGEKFADAYRKGNVDAVDFAYKYCLEHMGKKEAAAIEQKTAAKQNLAPGLTSTAVKTAPDVARLYKEAMADPSNEGKYLAWKAAQAKTKT
jgi:hypothetical protein